MKITDLQNFIKERDYKPELKEKYFMKLVEEVGELAEVIRKDKRMIYNEIKDSIEEELYDVLYYVCALANCYDIDLEECHKLKSELNQRSGMQMKTIMVDMDDVLTNGNFSKILENYLGYKPEYDNIKNYYIQDILGDKKDDFFNKFKDMNLYENAALFQDCYDVLKHLSERYKIYICTDYIWREIIEYAGNNLKNKYNFLYKVLDFIPPQNYIFTADKSIINCDIKIDDKIKNIEGAKTKLLFTAWHNKELSDEELKLENIIRVNNWKEIEEILLSDCKD